MTMVTTLLDAKDVSVDDLSELYGFRWFVGVSRLRTLHLVGESPTEVKDSSLVAWEASWRESKTMEPSDNIFRKEYAQCTRLYCNVNADVASSHAIRWLRRSITCESIKS